MGEFRRPKGPPHTPGPPKPKPKPKPGNGPGKPPKNKKLGEAAQMLVNMFNTYGLDQLADEVIKWAKQGVVGSELLFKVRQSKAYKTRFPGMEALSKNGYNAVSEAQYLELEDGYHRALESAGLPPGFYDRPGDFVKFMSNGMDATELHERAVAAVDLANQVDPAQRNLLRNLYGVSAGDIAAYFIDPKRAMGILQKQVETVRVANAAQKAGVGGDVNTQRFERLVDNGIDSDKAASGYAQIADFLPTIEGLADVYGTDYGVDEAEREVFYGSGADAQKRKRLIDREDATFSGSSGFVSTKQDRGAGQY